MERSSKIMKNVETLTPCIKAPVGKRRFGIPYVMGSGVMLSVSGHNIYSTLEYATKDYAHDSHLAKFYVEKPHRVPTVIIEERCVTGTIASFLRRKLRHPKPTRIRSEIRRVY